MFLGWRIIYFHNFPTDPYNETILQNIMAINTQLIQFYIFTNYYRWTWTDTFLLHCYSYVTKEGLQFYGCDHKNIKNKNKFIKIYMSCYSVGCYGTSSFWFLEVMCHDLCNQQFLRCEMLFISFLTNQSSWSLYVICFVSLLYRSTEMTIQKLSNKFVIMS